MSATCFTGGWFFQHVHVLGRRSSSLDGSGSKSYKCSACVKTLDEIQLESLYLAQICCILQIETHAWLKTLFAVYRSFVAHCFFSFLYRDWDRLPELSSSILANTMERLVNEISPLVCRYMIYKIYIYNACILHSSSTVLNLHCMHA